MTSDCIFLLDPISKHLFSLGSLGIYRTYTRFTCPSSYMNFFFKVYLFECD